eukprot:scaffold15732_cov137-Isochrysis_galbana.AAC.4
MSKAPAPAPIPGAGTMSRDLTFFSLTRSMTRCCPMYLTRSCVCSDTSLSVSRYRTTPTSARSPVSLSTFVTMKRRAPLKRMSLYLYGEPTPEKPQSAVWGPLRHCARGLARTGLGAGACAAVRWPVPACARGPARTWLGTGARRC